MQHGHEVRLTRTERAGEERAAARAGGDSLGHQAHSRVKRLDQRIGDDVFIDRALDRVVPDRVGQTQDVVLAPARSGMVMTSRSGVLTPSPQAASSWLSRPRSASSAGGWRPPGTKLLDRHAHLVSATAQLLLQVVGQVELVGGVSLVVPLPHPGLELCEAGDQGDKLIVSPAFGLPLGDHRVQARAC